MVKLQYGGVITSFTLRFEVTDLPDNDRRALLESLLYHYQPENVENFHYYAEAAEKVLRLANPT